MKTTSIKTKLLPVMLTLCMVLSLVPVSALAAATVTATETADFTAADDGVAALALLNQAKTAGAANSTWDHSSKTLTLRGIDFTTTATTAVKMPAGSTIVLADGTNNRIQSGDAMAYQNGEDKNQIFITALDALGNLTIKGNTGALSVTSGSHKNAGNGWTYSSAISVYGDLTVKGGHVTAQGGLAQATGSGALAFSLGINMDNNKRNKALLVTGGSLTAIGGEAYKISENAEPYKEFSRGVYMFRGNVSVSGDGKLTAQSVQTMSGAGILSSGLYISVGDLSISNEGEVVASGAYAVDISDGNLQLTDGKLTAASTQTENDYGYAIHVEKDSFSTNNSSNGNISVSGGTLETMNGNVYMYQYKPTDAQGLFTVSGGTVKVCDVFGANKVDISGGTVQTQQIRADELALSNATLIVREPVRKFKYDGSLFASSALCLKKLTVNSGTLDVAWDWGEYTPIVFPVDEDYGTTTLVEMRSEDYVATFNGGTTIFDTGCAGNLVMNLGQIVLGNGVVETGTDDSQIQKYDDTPVVFSDIARTPLMVSDIAVITKSYDATKSAQIDASEAKLSTVASGDNVYLGTDGVTAAFDNKNAGKDKSVSVTGKFQLRGKDSYKYTLTQPSLSNLKGTIIPCTTVINTTTSSQNVSKDIGTFDKPHIIGKFGESGSVSEIIETDTGTVTYTINAASIINATYDDVVAYLKTLDSDKNVELIYTFTGNENYAGAKFDDGNGGMTNIGTIDIQIVREAYTVTFDACGGNVTTASMTINADGKLENLPNNPTRSGYIFNGWYTEPTGGTKITTSTVFNTNTTVYAQWTYVIDEIGIDQASTDSYKVGDVPTATAFAYDKNQENYTFYEKWEELDSNYEPVAFWYSDEDMMNAVPTDKRIITFEEGKKYSYSIVAKPKDNYAFAAKDTLKVALNRENISNTNRVLVVDNGTLVEIMGKTMTPAKPIEQKEIELIEINNSTISFKDGDKPVFTGTTPDGAMYFIDFEAWKTDDAGITSSEFWNNDDHLNLWGGNLITAFDKDKTYSYVLYVKMNPEAEQAGWVFGPNTKLKVNGKDVEFSGSNFGEEYGSVYWLTTELTMTPQASGTTPDYKIIEGANGVWTQNSDDTLTFRANGDVSKFTGVKVDDNLISDDNYTVISGSTVITLKTDYLKTLSVGKHMLTVVYNDGDCSTNFEVKAEQNNGGNDTPDKPDDGNITPDKPNDENYNSDKAPQTGDSNNLVMWIALLFVNGGALTGIVIFSKKKKLSIK